MNRNELHKDMEARTAQAQAILGDPAKADEFKALTEKITVIGDQIRAMDKAEAELRAVKDAEKNVPVAPGEKRSGWKGFADSLLGMAETRVWKHPARLRGDPRDHLERRRYKHRAWHG